MSQSSENQPVGYFVLDKRRSLRWYSLSPDQKKWFAWWLIPALIIGAQWLYEDVRPISTLLLLMAAFGLKNKRGIFYRNIQADIEEWFLERNGGVLYEGEPRSKPPLGLKIFEFEVRNDQRAKRELIAKDLAPEDREAFLEQDSEAVMSLGTLYSSRERTDTAYVTGTGLKGSNGDPQELFQARCDLATALTNTVSLLPKAADVCLIYAQRPMSMIPDILWGAGNIDPAVQKARQLPLKNMGVDENGHEVLDIDTFFGGTTVEERQRAARDQALAHASLMLPEVTQVMAITIPRVKYVGAKRGQLPKKGLNSRQLKRMPIKRLADTLAAEASNAGVTGVRVLDHDGVSRFVRDGWDIDGKEAWDTELMRWVQEIERTGNADLEMPTPWMSSIRVVQTPAGRNCIQLGSTYFRVRPFESYSQPAFLANGLLPLIDNSSEEFELTRYVSQTLTLCGDVINMGAEYDMLTRQRVFQRARQKNKSKGKDLLVTEKDTEKEDALAHKSSRFYHGGAYALNYNALFTIGCPMLELIDDADEAIDARGRKVGVEFGAFDNNVRHARSLITGLWGVNMVNR